MEPSWYQNGIQNGAYLENAENQIIRKRGTPYVYTFCFVAIFSICHFGTPFACSEANLTNDNNEQLTELIR